MQSSHEFLFFGRSDNSFLENYYYGFPDEGEQKGGSLFVNLEIGNNPLDAEEIGAVLFETMQAVFFKHLEKDSYERFEDALKAVNDILSEFKNEKPSGYIGELNIIIAAVVGDSLFLTQTGDAEAYLVRKKFVSVVTDGLSENAKDSDDVFFSIASGNVEKGDFVLLSSTRLLRYISKTELAQVIVPRRADEILADIKDAVSSEILSKVGMIGVLFSDSGDGEVAMENKNGASAGRVEVDSGKWGAALNKGKEVMGKAVSGMTAKLRNRKGRSVRGRVQVGHNKDGRASNIFTNSKMVPLALGAIAIIVLVVMVSSGFFVSKEAKQYEAVLIGVEASIAEATTRVSYDKEAAKIMLDQAYEDSLEILNSGYFRNEAKTSILKINDLRDTLDGVIRKVDLVPLVDFGSLSYGNPNIRGFVKIGDREFIYGDDLLFELMIDNLQAPVSISEGDKIVDATGFEDRDAIMFLTDKGNIIEYNAGGFRVLSTSDGSFYQASDIESWGNRIYLLNNEGNQVWRYQFSGALDGFSKAEPYFLEEVDLAEVTDFVIDATILTLDQTGEIKRYLSGKDAGASINNRPLTALQSPNVIFTTNSMSEVFVLDGFAGRLLVFKKDTRNNDLNYDRQYLFDGVGEVRDMFVDQESNQVYLITKDKVYKESL
ncbi:hypothetical protein CVV38_04395 [Candidatus Peregrinibacteria bacterium HGW-Peregrinibacteria-1]|jgi:hypothetical protein|nr:MAG: hypothetical protein CVV38_04395 [Candidatus Peregrinibacteria bacterium HGW-Peregrinibacteria-1]